MKNVENQSTGLGDANNAAAGKKKRVEDMDNIEKVLYFFGNVWSSPYDLSLIDELMHEDFQITSAGKTNSGKDNFKEW